MIAGVRLGEFREFAVIPVEFTAVDNHSADRSAVPADIFGGGSGQNIHAVIERPDNANADGIIHHQRNPGIMGNLGQSFEIRDIQLGIADSFGINGAGMSIDGFLKLIQILRIDEFYRPAQFGESIMEKLIGAAVEVIGGNNIIARAG